MIHLIEIYNKYAKVKKFLCLLGKLFQKSPYPMPIKINVANTTFLLKQIFIFSTCDNKDFTNKYIYHLFPSGLLIFFHFNLFSLENFEIGSTSLPVMKLLLFFLIWLISGILLDLGTVSFVFSFPCRLGLFS